MADPRDVVRLEPSGDGTRAITATAQEIALVEAGYNVAEAMVKKMPIGHMDQLSIF